MKKVIAYIDGFNIYHAIDKNLPDYYKWIDYRKLCEQYLETHEELVDIIFFTATPRWDTEKIHRHHEYMRVLGSKLKIAVISGNYTSVQKKFIGGKHPVLFPKNAIVRPKEFVYGTFEEKQTDVNMALHIFEGGILDFYDKALIFTGDSDIAPSIIRVRKHKKDKEFVCILPFAGKGRVLSGVCNSHKSVTQDALDGCLLPETVEVFGKYIKSPYNKKPAS